MEGKRTMDDFKLVIFFDGTSNDVKSPSKFTNVKKLKDLIIGYGVDDNEKTIVTYPHYLEGPGTRPGTKVSGGAFAMDLDDIIFEAYGWLAPKYHWCYQEMGRFPEIYIFGFSRGAYLAHILSWLLNDVGVTKAFRLMPRIVKAYMDKNRRELESLSMEKDNQIKCKPTIRMLGLWDMVSGPFDLFSGFNDREVSPIVKKVYHAMSLDERRDYFTLLKYHTVSPSINQRWFSGVHSDVGGGYEDDTTLSDIALNWMVDNAVNEDLLIKGSEMQDPSDADFRRMIKHDEASDDEKNFRKCEMSENETVDESVYVRISMDNSYTPCAIGFPANNLNANEIMA